MRTPPLPPLPAACLTLLTLLAVGCNSAEPYAFNVSVENATDRPLTVGFVKHGPPFNPRWASPEDFASMPPSRQPDRWGMVIPPGRTMATRETAEMSAGADPVIRIYLGDRPLDELLAVSRGGGGRIDVGISPTAHNDFVITDVPPRGLTARSRHLASTPPSPPPPPPKE